jgi:hypothetical protein
MGNPEKFSSRSYKLVKEPELNFYYTDALIGSIAISVHNFTGFSRKAMIPLFLKKNVENRGILQN